MGEVFPLPLKVKIMVVGCEKYIFLKNVLLLYQIFSNCLGFYSSLYAQAEKLQSTDKWRHEKGLVEENPFYGEMGAYQSIDLEFPTKCWTTLISF